MERGQVNLPAGVEFIDENGGGTVPMLSTICRIPMRS